MTFASAPGKLILCGEHAVVYGRPAIALPLAGVRARAEVVNAPRGTGVLFDAPDIGRAWLLASAPDNPLSELVAGLLARLAPGREPDLRITVASDVPIASGMGSGAAIATAIVRALAAFFGAALTADEVSALVYGSERRFHGTPSGIDNTVVAFERAVWYQRTTDDGRSTTDQEDEGSRSAERVGDEPRSLAGGRPSSVIEPVAIAAPFTLLVGDTGVRSATRLPVGDVRRRREADPARYDALFDNVAAVVVGVRAALAQGDIAALGGLLDRNHELLREIGVSSPALEQLVGAAREAGARGAKLSGAGWGGVMIALVDDAGRAAVRAALEDAGAARVLETVVPAAGARSSDVPNH